MLTNVFIFSVLGSVVTCPLFYLHYCLSDVIEYIHCAVFFPLDFLFIRRKTQSPSPRWDTSYSPTPRRSRSPTSPRRHRRRRSRSSTSSVVNNPSGSNLGSEQNNLNIKQRKEEEEKKRWNDVLQFFVSVCTHYLFLFFLSHMLSPLHSTVCICVNQVSNWYFTTFLVMWLCL
jgi:hypothetical protein